MNKERPDYLRLIPIGVKAIKIGVEEREYEIYENNPYTNEKGTLVPTDDAIALISRAPDLVSGAYEIVNGESVSAIPNEIWVEINRKTQERIALSGTHEAPKKAHTMIPTSSNGALEEVIRSQSAIMASQNKQIETIMEQMTEMQKMMNSIVEKNKKK